MEFNEKLQKLRKEKNLTQEQLAEKLFVSRTAISKWESGKGYPSIDSLKEISKFFSVSIDYLLSGDELIEAVEKEKEVEKNKSFNFFYGTLDTLAILFIFIPLFANKEGDFMEAVSLLNYREVPPLLKISYYIVFIGMFLVGIIQLISNYYEKEKISKIGTYASLIINIIGVLIFAISANPSYATSTLFIFLIVKGLFFAKDLKIIR